MKVALCIKTFTAVAALLAVGSAVSSAQAQDQMAPPPSGAAPAAAPLPANIVPGSPLAEVIKMVQAGVDAATIQSYIVNSPSPFDLDADKIVFLKDEGVPSELINAMMDRDRYFTAANATPPPQPVAQPMPAQPAPAMAPDSAPPAAGVAAVETAPPAEVTVDYLASTVTPYGSWVEVDGYGRCWRPTVVVYDPNWCPYGDRGHWVNTDYGWYWDSDYSWGVTFHYGRWFRNPRFGWCWYPDTVWAPSWVTWRSSGDYCGWAPLPPFAVFRPGAGFFYRGVSVGVEFDFGLGADCFLFVSPDRFCDRHPRSFCVPHERVVEVYHHTTIINNFNVNNRTVVNRGISVEHITSVTHRPIETVHVNSLPNAGRQGFRGEGYQRTLHGPQSNIHAGSGNNNPGGRPAGGNGGNNPAHPGGGAMNNNAGATHGIGGGNAGVAHGNNGEAAAHGNNNGSPAHPNNSPGAASVNNAGRPNASAGSASGGVGANKAESFHSQGQAAPAQGIQSRPQGTVNQQSAAPQSGFGQPSHVTSQNSQSSFPQSHNYNNNVPAPASPQHGAEQLQQQPRTAPAAQPRENIRPAQPATVTGGAAAGGQPRGAAAGGQPRGAGNAGNDAGGGNGRPGDRQNR